MAASIFSFALAGCGATSSGAAPAPPVENDGGGAPVVQNLGERIFIDTRFSEFFFEHMTGVNDPLASGDPVVATTQTANGPVAGPFAGQSINCRSCHFVTEFTGTPLGNRTYSDFTDHSPIPRVMQGFDHTPRNAMQMVGTFAPHSGPQFLHFDGEFVDGADLVKQTMTGRNFGWTPDQNSAAIHHIANIIRNDNGNNFPSKTYTDGLSYATVFTGTDPTIPQSSLLQAQFRVDVATATDDEIVNAVCEAVSQYAQGLMFKQDEFGRYYASPYDVFLNLNHLPVQPRAGQTKQQYNAELLKDVKGLGSGAIFVTTGSYAYHSQPFQFGATEMQGLIIFLSAATNATDGSQHAGNCAACHQAPDFTDFSFHNTGVAQDEYDAVHGAGAFMALDVPNLSQRNANYDAYLPVTTSHPDASETFRHRADSDPQHADLGLWNIFLNPDRPNPQSAIAQVMCPANTDCTSDAGKDAVLSTTLARFKTPMLRDLEDSAPYLHNGTRARFNDVVEFYINSSGLAHEGKLRNAPPEFSAMSIGSSDIQALAAFLASLTEDYDDA